MPRRPLYVRVGWTLQDYAKRVWDNAGEDNIFFLAGGIAFNILLAVVPFVLLLVSGFATLLKHSADQTFAEQDDQRRQDENWRKIAREKTPQPVRSPSLVLDN